MNGWWPYGHGGLLPAPSRSSRLPPAGRSALPPSRPVRRSGGGPLRRSSRFGCEGRAAAAEGESPPLPARSRSFALRVKALRATGRSAKAGRRAKGGRATGRFGEGRPPPTSRQRISNPLDPNYRVPGAALGGDQNAPLSFTYVVHLATARNFLPCAGPLHPRLARSLRENRRRPRRPGRPSSPPPPPAQAAGLPFPRTSSSTVRGPVRGTGPLFARITGLRERAAGKPVPARPCPGHGFRRAVRTRLNRAGGPWPIHRGDRRIRNLGRK